MSFIAKEEAETNFELYKQLVREAAQINSRMNAWEGQFATLRAAVDAEKQGELDTKKAQFISALRTTLGI